MHGLIFLSFGHPEGFGLPVAEALASQCAVVGYDGIGGRELFNLSSNYGLSEMVPYGDYSFVNAIYYILTLHSIPIFSQSERMSSLVLKQYSFFYASIDFGSLKML